MNNKSRYIRCRQYYAAYKESKLVRSSGTRRFKMNAQPILRVKALGAFVLFLALSVACSSASATATPVPPTEVSAGGFSFQPVDGFNMEINAAEVSMAARDDKVKLILGGRAACELSSVERLLEGYLGVLLQDISELEASEPYPILIGGKEGLAVNVTGTEREDVDRKTYRYEMTGRLAVVVPDPSQVFYAFASARGKHWAETGAGAFDSVLQSIEFFEPIGDVRPIPCFISHPPPDLTVDAEAFEDAGCPPDRYGFRACADGSPLAAFGCYEISEPDDLLGGLEPSYPIAECSTGGFSREEEEEWDVEWLGVSDYDYNAKGGYFYRVGGRASSAVRYVMVRDDQFVLIETEDEFREIFAPIDSADEALSYVLAVTGLFPLYGLEPEPSLEYFVEEITDTHVETVVDAFLVNLFYHETFGCGPHRTLAVDFHITRDGHIKQLSKTPVLTNPERDDWCVD